MDVSNEGYALGELVKLVGELSIEIEKLGEDCVCWSYEGYAEDILVFEMDDFGIPSHDEVVMSGTNPKQPNFNEYPNKYDEEQILSMVHVYYDCEFDPWESHEGEKEELNV